MDARSALLLLASLAAAACSSSPSGAFGESPDPGARGSSETPGSEAPNGGAITLTSFGDPGSGSCVPGAPNVFLNAICSCQDLEEVGTLTTHALTGAASVAVNGRTDAITGADIAGSFTPYNGLTAGAHLVVRDDVITTETVDGAGVFSIGGDLSVGGDLNFGGELTVGGMLRLANPASVIIPIHSGGSGPYAAPAAPPCSCDASTFLPISQEIANAALHNDNAAHGLSTDGGSFLGVGQITLPTGSYYFHDVTHLDVGKINIQGSVSVYFDGTSINVGVGQFSVAAGSSLDLYIGGSLTTAGGVALGDYSHPEKFRLFVGGAGSTVATAGEQAWSGLIYAPQADIEFVGATEVHGAVFANSLTWGGALDVSYIGGVLSAGSSCPTPPAPPTAK